MAYATQNQMDSAQKQASHFGPATQALTDLTPVVLIEDHTLFRENLSMALEWSHKYQVCGSYGSAEAFLQALPSMAVLPQVALMDVCLPGMDGFEATYRAKLQVPDLKVIVLTSLQDQKAMEAAMAVKADGYCTKDTPLDELHRAIETVQEGHKWLDARIAQFLLKHPPQAVQQALVALAQNQTQTQSQTAAPVKQATLPVYHYSQVNTPPIVANVNPAAHRGQIQVENVLTPRELQILELIAQGLNNNDIANKVSISEAWIHGYIDNILVKLAVSSEVAAIEIAMECGYLQSAPLLEQQDSWA